MSSSDELPRRQQQLYDLLKGHGDVPILDLYRGLNPGSLEQDQRYAQQWLGPTITRANRRLARRGLRIQPGRTKGSYTLAVVA